MNKDLEHLLTLARRGGHRGASGGEQRIFNIVKCLLEDGRGLDPSASMGIVILIAALGRGDYEVIDQFSKAVQSASI